MPSQEDYLDQLLKNMSDEQKQNSDEEDSILNLAPDIDEISSMSEDEIMQLLAAGENSAEENDISEEPEDVLDMLTEPGDNDLQAIQELLQKSDNNEMVEEENQETEAQTLTTEPDEDKLASSLEKKQKRKEEAAARKAQKEAEKKEKAASRKAAKEAKNAEKEAKIAEKKAKNEEKKAKAAEKKARAAEKAAKADVEEVNVEAGQPTQQDLEQQEQDFDTSVLDSIVSEAESLSAEGDAELQPETEESASNIADDLDLSSLFGDTDDETILNQEEQKIDFPDFVALKEEDADALLRDVTEQEEKGKKGFFAKLFDFLTEEDEEEQKGNENIQLSEENQEILNDLDREEGKKKKKNKKKGKKADGEEKEDGKKPAKKAKEKKPKKEKPKKEKVPKEKESPLIPEKKLSFKKVIPTILIAISLAVLLIVFVHSSTDYTDRKTARTAFYAGDYQTCYQNLHGKELNESEHIMYAKSESILYIRIWLREYEMFAEEGDEMRALDSLIQTVDQYPGLYTYAVQWNAGSEVAAGYDEILNILADKYGLTQEQAQAIADEPDDKKYTRKILEIIRGESVEASDTQEMPTMPDKEELPDELPEETELGKEIFINNQ